MHIDKWTNGAVVGKNREEMIRDGKGCLNHLCCIVDAIQGGAAGLVEVVVGGGREHLDIDIDIDRRRGAAPRTVWQVQGLSGQQRSTGRICGSSSPLQTGG